MRLLWVLVAVGVVGGVAKEEGERRLTLEDIYKLKYKRNTEEEERQEACRGDEDEELCRKGFLFTATALQEVRSGEDLEVMLTLEKSLHPHVNFDLSLRSGDYRDFYEFSQRGDEKVWPEEKVIAREEVTLGVNELRRVELRVSDLPWRTAYLVVTALPVGHTEGGRHLFTNIQKVASDAEVFVQAEKSTYAPGETVNYRALVVDGNVDKQSKFAQVITKRRCYFCEEVVETFLPWVEVPESGILRGNFTFDRSIHVRVRVTSNVTSSDSSMATSPNLEVTKSDSSPSQRMSASLEGLSDVCFSQPRVKGRVKLTSPEGIPLEGNCNVTMTHNIYGAEVFAHKMAERRVAVGLAGGEFEFDVVGEMGPVEWKGEEKYTSLYLKAKCIDLHSGSVDEATDPIQFWRTRFRVTRNSVGSFRRGNSSQTTVVLTFLLERWDGGSVEEPSKGVQVRLLLSEENLRRLRPSATNFSLPIPPSGEVRLEFQVNQPTPVPWSDTYQLKVRDEEAEVSLDESPNRWFQKIHVTPVDPARLIQRGDVVVFRVRSCLPYDSVNAILSSHKAIYASRRFSFSSEREELDEVIELTIPQNVTEGTLNLLVFSRSTHPQDVFKIGNSALVKVNVVPSNGPQYIRIVDQVDVDMSTVVTFRLEGVLANSVVSLQAAKDETKRLLKLHEDRNLECDNPGVKTWDYSPGYSDPRDVYIFANFFVIKPESSFDHPPLVFVDVDRKTSTEDNGTFTVTKTFDRLTQFGTYVVSGATFNSKSGRTAFSNSPVLEILPPRVTLSVLVAPSVVVGETVEVLGYVKNNLATPYEGHVALETREGGSTEIREEFVKINPNAYEFLRMNVTPQIVGDLFVSLKSNISSRLTATKKVSVTPLN